METLLGGIDDLRTVVKPGEVIATLDMTNPFPFLMNAPRAEGFVAAMHMNRTISEDVHPTRRHAGRCRPCRRRQVLDGSIDRRHDEDSFMVPELDVHYAARMETAILDPLEHETGSAARDSRWPVHEIPRFPGLIHTSLDQNPRFSGFFL